MLLAALALPKINFASTSLISSTGVSDETLFVILAVIAAFQLVVIMVIAGVIKSIASNHDVWKMRWNKNATALAALMLFGASTAMAVENDYNNLVQMNDTGFMALLFINVILFFTFVYLTSKLNGLMKMLLKDEKGKVPETFMDKINTMLTDAVPLEKEHSVEMDHEYDGIRELDNNLPPWWLWGFYASIVFAVVYMVNYHVTGNGMLQSEEYAVAMQDAEDAKAAFVATQENVVDESNVELLTDASDLASGEKIFKLYCGPCHGENGGSMPGGVGPNLTDDYWINGGSVTDIFKTIKYGVPEKGMVSWEAQLNPTKIQQVSSYIKSLRGTNPPNAKEAQGDLYTEEAAAPAEEVETQVDSSATPIDGDEDVTLVE
jgi:cytochrome c oxidase cbb3-type subunit 3